MSRFQSSGHLVSWAGLCPHLDESAGKRRSTRIRHGAPWLKTALVQAAWAASRMRQGHPRAQFARIRARRGPRKAVVAVAASLLTAAYFILRDRTDYRDLGSTYFDAHKKERVARRLARRIEALGFNVEIEAA
jgi:transposase